MLLKRLRGVGVVVGLGLGSISLVHKIIEVGLQQEMHMSGC